MASIYQAAANDLRRNARQWAAYESIGHCVVLAGPGSGKTKTLTIKLAQMLAEAVRPPRGIACITYNNQCAKELRKRLHALEIEENSRVFVGTVHSFCLREVLIPYGRLAGLALANNLAVASVSEQERLFQRAVKSILGDENPQWLRTPFDEFRRTVLDRSSPHWTENDRFSPLIEEYERLLLDNSKIDFDGMVLEGLKIISKNEWLRKALKAKYPILAIDEYQDLGVPLHEIVLNLCFSGGIRLFAVGDPDQSIYGFTGARPELLATLAARTDVQDIRLKLNYRCGRTIIAASTTALAEDRDFESAEGHEGTVDDYLCPDGFGQQIDLLTRKIIPESLKRRRERCLGDIGVLYLNQYDGAEIARAVEKAGIPYVRFDQGNPYPRTPLTSWLEDCASWCSGGWREGHPKLSSLIQGWLRFNPSLARDSDKAKARRKLVSFLSDTRDAAIPLRVWLENFKKRSLYEGLKSEVTMFDELEVFDKLCKVSDETKALAHYTIANLGGQRGSPGQLNLTTIHSAKGLEYDVVIMMRMEQGLLPRYDARTSEQKREPRRQFYVALTRARHEVHITYSGWYERGSRQFRDGPSEFVTEIKKKMQEQ